MSEDWGTGFTGRPFEALGNVNSAIYPSGAESLVERVPEFLEEAAPVAIQHDRQKGIETALLSYPQNSPAALGMLISNLHSEDPTHLQLISLYPILQGLPASNLEILNFKSWYNQLEGMVAVSTSDFADLNFFDPYFFEDQQILERGSQATCYLAALGFKIRVAENSEFPVTQGELYDDALAEFLEENPDKSEEDFTPPMVSMALAQVLLPTPYTGEYQFRALACSKEDIPFLENRLIRYQIVFSNEAAEEAPDIWLYVAPHCIEGREPLVGEFIEGVFWLSGHLPQRTGKNPES